MRKVISAAAQQFTERGFERASMESVAQASGVSKMTIYSYFRTKAALFEAVIGQRVGAVFSFADGETLDPGDARKSLTLIGRRFLTLIRADDVLGRHRALYGATNQAEAARRAFYRQGPLKSIEQVASYLVAASRSGSLEVRNPGVAADQFLSLFLGAAHIHALLGLGKPTSKEDQRLIDDNVDFFMRAHARRL
jgi:TetR/AcrR family transcriptional repressor of mexJK operon